MKVLCLRRIVQRVKPFLQLLMILLRQITLSSVSRLFLRKENSKRESSQGNHSVKKENQVNSGQIKKRQSQQNVLVSNKGLRRRSGVKSNCKNKRNKRLTIANDISLRNRILSPNEENKQPIIRIHQSFKSPKNPQIPSIINDEDYPTCENIDIKFFQNTSKENELEQSEERKLITSKCTLKFKGSVKKRAFPKKMSIINPSLGPNKKYLNSKPKQKSSNEKTKSSNEKTKNVKKGNKDIDIKAKPLKKNLKSKNNSKNTRLKKKHEEQIKDCSHSENSSVSQVSKRSASKIDETKIDPPVSKFKQEPKPEVPQTSGINIDIGSNKIVEKFKQPKADNEESNSQYSYDFIE
ncbi:unnamed protein product [Moneuplotes crassus]|uniref:Uncharacterized protein n=1 Tax=Euplotes crassus TaxID=5936 RepID=A0AAD1XQ55_EUPCR|nr:unnamed protein product [Moneuplotes crassus]